MWRQGYIFTRDKSHTEIKVSAPLNALVRNIVYNIKFYNVVHLKGLIQCNLCHSHIPITKNMNKM